MITFTLSFKDGITLAQGYSPQIGSGISQLAFCMNSELV